MADQAFQYGSVSGFAGATGLLQALLDFVIGTEVSSEALSGSGANWSGTLAHYPVGYGRLTISYTIAGQDYEATDDGAGNITGTSIVSGTFDYTTGDYDITFAASVTGTPTADYLYGEPGQDWKLLQSENTHNKTGDDIWGGTHKEVILQNTGLSGLEQVMIGIREWYYLGGNAYGWNLNGYLWYNSGMSWRANLSEQGSARETYNTTYNTWSVMPNVPFIDSTMYYWIFSNRQRIIMVIKVQSNYESMYLGFGNRYASPSRYAYPLVIKGSHYGAGNQADTGAWRRGIHRNIYSSAGTGYPLMVVDPGGGWRSAVGAGWALGPIILPGDTLVDSGSMGILTSGDVFSMTVTAGNGEDGALWLDLDGVKQLLGPNIQSEDILRDIDNKKKYIIFQDVSRTSYVDFFGVEQGPYTTTTTSTTTSTTV